MITYKLVYLDDVSGLEQFILEERDEEGGFPQNFSGDIGTSEGSGPLLRIERIMETPE